MGSITLAPPRCSVHVVATADAAFATACLTDAERRRAGRIVDPAARRSFLLSRQVAREVVAATAGLDPSDVELAEQCEGCGSADHGAPRPVGGTYVSWAHTAGAVAVVAGPGRVGVDLEPVAAFGGLGRGVERALCTAAELAALPDGPGRAYELARLWTAKEALVKVGEASLDSLRDHEVGLAPGPVRRWRGRRQWLLTEVPLAGYVCTVASATPLGAVRTSPAMGVAR